MITYFALFFIVIGLLRSCNRENTKYDKPYFDFDSLVNTQTFRLSTTKIKVIKTSALNGKQDSALLVPDSTQWRHELDAFQQLDVINKPLFENAYHFTEGKDDHSNLRV